MKIGGAAAVYHCMTRTVNGEMLFEDREKEDLFPTTEEEEDDNDEDYEDVDSFAYEYEFENDYQQDLGDQYHPSKVPCFDSVKLGDLSVTEVSQTGHDDDEEAKDVATGLDFPIKQISLPYEFLVI